ncbi:MAG: hypothetical protein Q7S40_29590 [Opitutaceae bacterium]|nr:hypothetical protein [Opitutaceae bacterium]
MDREKFNRRPSRASDGGSRTSDRLPEVAAASPFDKPLDKLEAFQSKSQMAVSSSNRLEASLSMQ